MQNQCAEIKTRAGEILKEQEKHEGVRPAPEIGNRVLSLGTHYDSES